MTSEQTPGPSLARILVADDEPHIRRVLGTLLRNASYEVEEVTDGREAIGRIRDGGNFDCILLDLMMPHASGLDVLEFVRADPQIGDTPVLILTAKGQDTDRDEALSSGADDFLTKPFSPKKLLARIQEILGSD